MKKKRVIFLCRNVSFIYNSIASIYTKYPDRNVDIDVILILCEPLRGAGYIETVATFYKELKKCKYINNIFFLRYDFIYRYLQKLNKKKKNFINLLKYNLIYKKQLQNMIKYQINLSKYSDIFYAFDIFFEMSMIKLANPRANYITYGDGLGGIFGSTSKLINFQEEKLHPKFIKEIKPNEIIVLLPYTADNSVELDGVPIRATDKNILLNLIKSDEHVQNEINAFTDEILNKYKNHKKTLLLLSMLDDPIFLMSEEEQINIYVDIINKYCKDGSVLIIKGHPERSGTIAQIITEKFSDKLKIVNISSHLNEFPMESFFNLVQNVDNVITFISSAKPILNYLYNVNCIDAREIVEEYPLIHRMGKDLESFDIICKRIQNWDKKSLIYAENHIPFLQNFYDTYAKK